MLILRTLLGLEINKRVQKRSLGHCASSRKAGNFCLSINGTFLLSVSGTFRLSVSGNFHLSVSGNFRLSVNAGSLNKGWW